MYSKLLKLAYMLDILGIKKEKEAINFLIKEAASKANALKNMGFSEEYSKKINDICRGYSLWIVHAAIKRNIAVMDLISLLDTRNGGKSEELADIKKLEAIKDIERNFNSSYRDEFQTIMDWVNVALNGDFKPYKNTDYVEILRAAQQWHKDLQESGGNINYVEENDIIIDFRQPDGQGFYWADLNTNSCSEEAERMGHCGTTGARSNLYSLRKVTRMNSTQMLNKSILTAAINSDGMITQLKGPKNSKPKEEYHKYIEALLLYKEDEDNLVNGFQSEYQSETDFSIADIKDDDILKKIIEENPNLLNQIGTKIIVALRLNDESIRSSMSAKIDIDKSFFDLFSPDTSSRYGRTLLSANTLYEIFSGSFDEFEMLSGYQIDKLSFESLYRNSIDEKNKNTILDIYKKNMNEISELSINTFLDDYIFEEMKEMGIVSLVSSADELCVVQAQVNEVYDRIIKFLSNFGKVERETDTLIVNLFDLVKDAISSSDKSEIINIINEIDEDDIDSLSLKFIKICYDREIFGDTLKIDMDRIYGRCKNEDFNYILGNLLESNY